MIDKRARPRPEPLRASFAKMERGRGITELLCRVCGTVIGKLLPVGAEEVRRLRDRTIVETQVQFCYLANYREVEIENRVGFGPDAVPGRHVGCACVACAEKLAADLPLLERFCETDLAQWRGEGHKITERMDRRPVKVLRVADQIRD